MKVRRLGRPLVPKPDAAAEGGRPAVVGVSIGRGARGWPGLFAQWIQVDCRLADRLLVTFEELFRPSEESLDGVGEEAAGGTRRELGRSQERSAQGTGHVRAKGE